MSVLINVVPVFSAHPTSFQSAYLPTVTITSPSVSNPMPAISSRDSRSRKILRDTMDAYEQGTDERGSR